MSLTIVFGIAAGITVIGTSAACAYERLTKKTIEFTVKDKGMQVSGDANNVSSEFLVHTEGESFVNTMSVFNGKFKSEELQGQLEIGKTYQARVYGKRMPFLGVMRNIISVEDITPAEKLTELKL